MNIITIKSVILVISVIITDNMKEVKNKKESFKNSSLLNLCEKNGNPREANDLDKRCNELNKKQCNLAECCSFIKFKNESKEICSASRDGEPIFKNSKKNNPVEYYLYRNKKVFI